MNLTIKEVKEKLQDISHEDDLFIQECKQDERKGVQTALNQWYNKRKKLQKLIIHYEQMNYYENQAQLKGYQAIAGIDEVGRGPLAGPVVAAAVILNEKNEILGLDDSKKLTLRKREELFDQIYVKARAIGIGIVDAEEIDHYNILGATKIAMNAAINDLNIEPDFLLVDAVELQNDIQKHTLVQGDLKSNSIAAASIIAKVTRDRLMMDFDKKYPGYGFLTNSGYGTKKHLDGLKKYGITPIHRNSFAPVKKYLK